MKFLTRRLLNVINLSMIQKNILEISIIKLVLTVTVLEDKNSYVNHIGQLLFITLYNIHIEMRIAQHKRVALIFCDF